MRKGVCDFLMGVQARPKQIQVVYPEGEWAPDEPDDLSDPAEPVSEDEVVSSDDDGYKGGTLSVGRIW
jgi:hypothetical protein